MGDSVTKTATLTPQQELFLSKYLHYVPKVKILGIGTKKAHDKETKYNNKMRADFLTYEDKKASLDGVLEDVGSDISLLRSKLTAIPSGADSPEMKKFRTTFDERALQYTRLAQDVINQDATVRNAPKDAPKFAEGAAWMGQKEINARWLKDNLPTLPKILNDGALPPLFTAKQTIADIQAFKGSSQLNEKIVKLKLADNAADKIRVDQLKIHTDKCVFANTKIDLLITQARVKPPTQTPAQLSDSARRIVETLTADLQAPLKALTDAINGQAKNQLAELAKTNPVAATEELRLNKTKESADRIDVLLLALAESSKSLKTKFAEATGYKEKQAILAKIKDEKKRVEDLKANKVQLQSYDSQLALRVGRIEAGNTAGIHGQALADDPVGEIAKLNPQPTAIPDTPEQRTMLVYSGLDKNGKLAQGRYQFLTEQFTRASQRVTVDAKLYPGEPDLFDISAEQFGILTDMLDKGKELVESGDLTKGSYLMDEANKLYLTFLSANKFSLPPIVPAVPPVDVKLDIAIKAGGADLDDFWGWGGDADGAFRKILNAIRDERDVKVKAGQTGADDLKDLQARIEKFREDVAEASENFTPPQLSPKGKQAKDNAKAARNSITEDLLKLYKTKELQLSEIGDIPANKLLSVERNGKTVYFEILTKRDDTQDRREDKDIPFEALNMLYERSEMLNLLSQEDPIDDNSAKAMEDIVKETQDMMTAIKGGSKDYAHVFERIKECKKLEAEKIFASWVPDGFYENKTEFKNFSGDYATKYLPADAKAKIDEIYTTFGLKKTEAEKLKSAYAEAEKSVKAVEHELDPSKKSKGSPAMKLQDLIKADPKTLMKDMNVGPQDGPRMIELERQLKNNIAVLKQIGIKNGLEGKFTAEVDQARQFLETKSATGIKTAKDKADKLLQDIKTQMQDLTPALTMDYFEKLAAFVKNEAEGAEKAKANKDAAEKIRHEISDLFTKVDKVLDDNKATLGSYKEYRTVYSSQKKSFEATEKGYKAETTPVSAALDQFKQQFSSADQLFKQVSVLTVVRDPVSDKVDFKKWQEALTLNIDKVRIAASAAARTLRAKAQGDDPAVVTAADNAAKVLDIAGAPEITSIATFKVNLGTIADDALKLQGEARKTAMAKARETALAEVRRIRAETEKHPALTVYRDNPMDKGAGWPQFASALHAFEVEILTKLNPA